MTSSSDQPLRRMDGELWICKPCRITWIRDGEQLARAPRELDYFAAEEEQEVT